MNDEEIEKEVDEVMTDIRERGEPDKMSKENYREYLSSLINNLQVELQAAEETAD